MIQAAHLKRAQYLTRLAWYGFWIMFAIQYANTSVPFVASFILLTKRHEYAKAMNPSPALLFLLSYILALSLHGRLSGLKYQISW